MAKKRPSNDEVLGFIERAADPSRAARVSRRGEALRDLLAEWEADVMTTVDGNVIDVLKAIDACLLGADEAGLKKLGITARAILRKKTS